MGLVASQERRQVGIADDHGVLKRAFCELRKRRMYMRYMALALVMFFVIGSCAGLSMADDGDVLLEMLVKKGVITEDEAKAVRESKKPVKDALTDLLKQKGVITSVEAAVVKASTPTPPAEPKKDEGPFYWKSGEAEAKLSGWAQVWYTATEDIEDVVVDTPDTFAIRRARITLAGTLTPWNEFSIQYDLRANALQDARFTFKDMPFLKETFLAPLCISAGQYKIPLSYVHINGGGTSADFIRDPYINDAANYNGGNASWLTIANRDMGVMLHGKSFEKKNLEWNLGIFNGNGINANDTNDQKDLLISTVVWPWKGDDTALAGLGFGGGMMVGHAERTRNTLYANSAAPAANATMLGQDRERYAATILYSYKDFFARAEWFYQSYERFEWNAGNVREDRVPVITTNWYAEAGYKFIPELQGVLRYQQYSPSQVIEDDDVDCLSVGLNWFVNKYSKLMFNYNMINEQGDEANNDEFLIQLEVKF
jgi:hypothetical protein